jgi:A/G-specific adenine glycosylase
VKRAGIGQILLAWFRAGHRDLPWRGTRDPYRILVSEIMLQQTRAQAAIPYYARFLERFPTAEALAEAPEEAVLTAWSGLGYYSRARNLRRSAQAIVSAGVFPRDYEGLRALPGVGDYTAAAVGSIAFGLARAVLDGNVLRVVARITGDAADIGAPRTRERFRAVAQLWLDPEDPGHFNQAMMELGATVCLPRNPLCLTCPVEALCRARAESLQNQLPVKLRKTEPVFVDAALLVIVSGGRVLLQQRPAGSRRMAGFWDLPSPEQLPEAEIGVRLGEFRHTITHHRYRITVFAASATEPAAGSGWFHTAELDSIPLSTTALKALRISNIL